MCFSDDVIISNAKKMKKKCIGCIGRKKLPIIKGCMSSTYTSTSTTLLQHERQKHRRYMSLKIFFSNSVL